jgi:hypothetical protein
MNLDNIIYGNKKKFRDSVFNVGFLVGITISFLYFGLEMFGNSIIYEFFKIEIPVSTILPSAEYIVDTLFIGVTPYLYTPAILAGLISFFILNSSSDYIKIGALTGILSSSTILLQYLGHLGFHIIRAYTSQYKDINDILFVLTESVYGFFYPMLISMFLGIIGSYFAYVIQNKINLNKLLYRIKR